MDTAQSPSDRIHMDPMKPVIEFLRGIDPDEICRKHGISREELEKRVESYQDSRRRMALQEHFTARGVGRNEPCPCGSGRKYKKCCLPAHEEARKNIPPDRLKEIEESARLREKLKNDVKRGFEYLFEQDYSKARRYASRLLETYPEDDRLHDIVVTALLAEGAYDEAFALCRARWQIAVEEKEFYQENGYHKREGMDRKNPVCFFSPSTWLEKFWIARSARAHRESYPPDPASPLRKLVDGLKAANDVKRFPGRREDGYEMRRQALDPLIAQIQDEGTAVLPYLLPLTYSFSWAGLFVPDLLASLNTDECIRLLAELSMFRFPFFSQKCLSALESFGARAIGRIEPTLSENPAFDELKIGLLAVLGSIPTRESFDILARFTQHDNLRVAGMAASALERHGVPDAEPYITKAKERLESAGQIAEALREMTDSPFKE